MPTPVRALVTAFVFLFAAGLTAQGIDPVGRVHPQARPLADVDVVEVPAFDRQALAAEDLQRQAAGLPARFAVPHAVAITPDAHGTWEALDGEWSLWRLRLRAPGANHVNLGFRRFHLPGSGRLMVYSADYTMVVRPFDQSDHHESGQLWTPVVHGAEIVAELYVLAGQRRDVALELQHIGAGYRFFGADGTDGSGSCQIDVVCPQAAAWANEIRSVARITIGGTSLCSGALVNNTAQDRKNYFLTADHCGAAGNPASVVAYWNYQNTVCGGPDNGSLGQFTSGATLRATWATGDFTLLELNGTINPLYGVTYAGWNRTTAITPSLSSVGIHHPSGDVKKISFDNNPSVTTSYGGTSSPGNGNYVRVINWEQGSTEPGSSGSPLFDQNRRIIGQLSGGGSACGNTQSDWYGKFGACWAGGGTNASRLSNWLDPLGTAPTVLDTLVPAYAANEVYGTGCYQRTGTFFEAFAAGTFDLAGTPASTRSLALTPITNGYQVQDGPDAWFAPTSTPLAMVDDGLITFTLPFLFFAPGGGVSQVTLCGNGFVWLTGGATDGDYTPTGAELAAGPRRFAPYWMDLNAQQGGSCHYDVDPSGTAVYFTWLNVPAWSSGAPGAGNTFQLVLRQNQTVEYRYRSVTNYPGGAVVGWSRGATAVPAPRDLSATVPFQVTIDGPPLSFTALGRPIQGTTQQFLLQNIVNPTASIGLVLAGPRLPGVDLAVIGMPECFLYTTGDILFSFLTPSATYFWNLFLPVDPALTGSKVACQGGQLTAGVNSFGGLTANAIELTIGTL
ncbi:MAG: trypsin-like peptidase domain-containing protein [Planctomycetes bacterium]|nr:trypsin-like peptidase domain-containing protein [Planctomycetota bacterium]